MTTNRDLAEAHQFHRRRLVNALLSGAPAGREAEPRAAGRTLLGGVALALLVLAAGPVSDEVLHQQPAADVPAGDSSAPSGATDPSP